MYRIGMDVGGTKLTVGVFEEETKTLLCKDKLLIRDFPSPAALLPAVRETVFRLLSACGGSPAEVSGVGVGIPGTVSDDGRTILKVPNLSALSADFADRLEDCLGLPCTMAQDSRAAAWGEYLCGGGQGASLVVCVTLGTGIGTGIVQNGEIYPGPLGCAGELGHLPVVENGRPCGCGKTGCLEKYAAGGGLDLTAQALLGEGRTAADLFAAAEAGGETALAAIREAVELLGRGLCAIVNLLSPDCLLFSGGLCEQEALYLRPLIDYIRTHCYAAGRLPRIEKGALADLSPLYGAAFLPVRARRSRPLLSASVMCADVFDLRRALLELEAAGIDYLHCDIMDNHFVPNLMLPMELLNKLKTGTRLPFDYHIMAENPETVIEKLNLAKGDIVSVHYESTLHLQKVVALIKSRSAAAAVALNPSTPLSVLEEILPELDMVLLMTVNPGFAGQKLVPGALQKIARLRRLLTDRGCSGVLIQVDGNCSFTNIPKMYQMGADCFVTGTSSVFHPDGSIAENTEKLRLTIGGSK